MKLRILISLSSPCTSVYVCACVCVHASRHVSECQRTTLEILLFFSYVGPGIEIQAWLQIPLSTEISRQPCFVILSMSLLSQKFPCDYSPRNNPGIDTHKKSVHHLIGFLPNGFPKNICRHIPIIILLHFC